VTGANAVSLTDGNGNVVLLEFWLGNRGVIVDGINDPQLQPLLNATGLSSLPAFGESKSPARQDQPAKGET